MAKKTFFCLALVLGVLLAANPALACHKTAFGPKQHGIGWLRIHLSFKSFKVDKPGEGLIEISRACSKSRIYSGFVLLNGQFISLHSILSGKASVMEATVQLRKRNYLLVFFYGQRGACLRIKVKVKEKEAEPPPPVNNPPVADATATPPEGNVGNTLILDGSRSTDPDEDTLYYKWTLEGYPEKDYPAGTKPVINQSESAQASFVPLVLGQYEFKLVVRDRENEEDPSVKVSSTPVIVDAEYPDFALTEEKLMADNGAAGDLFGSSVSVEGDRAIIGAQAKGAAYIFDRNSPWAQKHELTGAAAERFGSALAVSGDYALVGAPGAEVWARRFSESAYTRGTNVEWDSEVQGFVNPVNNRILLYPKEWAQDFRPKAVRMTHNAPGTLNLFRVISVGNDILGTASPYESGAEVLLLEINDIGTIFARDLFDTSPPPVITNIEFLIPAGAVHVFKSDEEAGWGRQAELAASDGKAGDQFGASLALSGEIAVVGAPGANAAYVFLCDSQTWIEGNKLLVAGGKAEDLLGTSVAVSDDVIIVGAPGAEAAYVFVWDGSDWVEKAKLFAYDGQAGDQFGASVAIAGNVAVVGAPGADAAYVFWYNGKEWIEETTLVAGNGNGDEQFGASVSISNNYAVVGAPNADGSGALYVFRFDGYDWVSKGKVTPEDNDWPDGQNFGRSVAISGDAILAGAVGSEAAYAYTIDTYQAAGISAEPAVVTSDDPTTEISWWWVNALLVGIDQGVLSLGEVHIVGEGSAARSPGMDTSYILTMYGLYGKDVALVPVFVE